MTIIEALRNALELLESLGYKRGGDIHDDLMMAIEWLAIKHGKIANEELPLP